MSLSSLLVNLMYEFNIFETLQEKHDLYLMYL